MEKQLVKGCYRYVVNVIKKKKVQLRRKKKKVGALMENIKFKIIRLDWAQRKGGKDVWEWEMARGRGKKLQQNETRKQTSKTAISRISLLLWRLGGAENRAG